MNQKETTPLLPPLLPMYGMPIYPFFNPFSPPQPKPMRKRKIGKYQFSFDRRLGEGLTSQAYIGVNK